MLAVRESTVDAIMGDPAFPALLAEYAAESAIAGMPAPEVKMAQYGDLEANGFLQAFEAAEDGELAGFITVLSAPLPHFGRTVAVSESFFVTSGHRGFAGLKLLVAAERQALAIGSPGLLVSAPVNSRLAALLPKCGYTETSRVFFKAVDNV